MTTINNVCVRFFYKIFKICFNSSSFKNKDVNLLKACKILKWILKINVKAEFICHKLFNKLLSHKKYKVNIAFLTT
jgi:hypothetical protein